MSPNVSARRSCPSDRRRVMVVENDDALALMLELVLDHAGYDVIAAADGRAAESLIDQSPPPDAVLVETFLPYRGGFELLEMIRTREDWSDVRVLLLSNNASGTDALRARRAGADACLVKPLGIEGLLARLERPLPSRAGGAERHASA